jgi:hypothetical protein
MNEYSLEQHWQQQQQQAKFIKLSTPDAALADLVELHQGGFPVTWPPGFDYTSAKRHLRVLKCD